MYVDFLLAALISIFVVYVGYYFYKLGKQDGVKEYKERKKNEYHKATFIDAD